jgi:hypothetical protein
MIECCCSAASVNKRYVLVQLVQPEHHDWSDHRHLSRGPDANPTIFMIHIDEGCSREENRLLVVVAPDGT